MNTETDLGPIAQEAGPPITSFLRDYSATLEAYHQCLESPDYYSGKRLERVAHRLSKLLCSKKESASATVLIPTYRPTALLTWSLDRLSQQNGPIRGSLSVVVFHNGSESGSCLPDSVKHLIDRTPLVCLEESRKCGIHGGRSAGLWRAYQQGLLEGEVVYTIDDDIAPISPSWLRVVQSRFQQDRNLGAFHLPVIFAGPKKDMPALNLYKTLTLSGQILRRSLLRSVHLTDGVAAFRKESLMSNEIWDKTKDFNLISGSTYRQIIQAEGLGIDSSYRPQFLVLQDAHRILQERGGLRSNLAIALGLQIPGRVGQMFQRKFFEPYEHD